MINLDSSIKIRPNKYQGKIQLPPDLIPIEKEDSKLVDSLPYYILKHGDEALLKLAELSILPPTVNAILKITAKGIKYLAKRYSV